MEPARLLGTCKPGSRAGMDSRTGVEGIINDLGNEVEEEKKINVQFKRSLMFLYPTWRGRIKRCIGDLVKYLDYVPINCFVPLSKVKSGATRLKWCKFQ